MEHKLSKETNSLNLMEASCVLFKECVVGSITCLQLQLYAALQQEGQQSGIA
jgi:hypothetical protein